MDRVWHGRRRVINITPVSSGTRTGLTGVSTFFNPGMPGLSFAEAQRMWCLIIYPNGSTLTVCRTAPALSHGSPAQTNVCV